MLCLESECSNWGRLTAWDSLISCCDQSKGKLELTVSMLEGDRRLKGHDARPWNDKESDGMLRYNMSEL